MPLNVLAIADIVSPQLYDYFCPERWRDVDLVLSAGDLVPEYLDFLASSLNVPVFYVRGNHDAAYHRERYDGFENVHGRIVEYRGLRIAGFEGCRRYNAGKRQYSESEMRRWVRWTRLRAMRTGAPNLVLTHAPPAQCHDGDDICHRGFECFRDAISSWEPAYFVHGHMHNYTGGPAESRIGSTTVVNAFGFRRIEIADPVPATVDHQAVMRPEGSVGTSRVGPKPGVISIQ